MRREEADEVSSSPPSDDLDAFRRRILWSQLDIRERTRPVQPPEPDSSEYSTEWQLPDALPAH